MVWFRIGEGAQHASVSFVFARGETVAECLSLLLCDTNELGLFEAVANSRASCEMTKSGPLGVLLSLGLSVRKSAFLPFGHKEDQFVFGSAQRQIQA